LGFRYLRLEAGTDNYVMKESKKLLFLTDWRRIKGDFCLYFKV